uniref:Uncharacterized protein n=1 Tax=Cannabis sativa TaxID=3483 RepID=A0A803PUV4_CANSA
MEELELGKGLLRLVNGLGTVNKLEWSLWLRESVACDEGEENNGLTGAGGHLEEAVALGVERSLEFKHINLGFQNPWASTTPSHSTTQIAMEAVYNHRIVTSFGSLGKVLELFEEAQEAPRKEARKKSWMARIGLGSSQWSLSSLLLEAPSRDRQSITGVLGVVGSVVRDGVGRSDSSGVGGGDDRYNRFGSRDSNTNFKSLPLRQYDYDYGDSRGEGFCLGTT